MACTAATAEVFLASDASGYPSLVRVDVPLAARAEYLQQTQQTATEAPVYRYRVGSQLREWKPTFNCPYPFKYIYSGFCCARRTVSAKTVSEAEALVAAETEELLANYHKHSPKFNSLPPRALAVCLLVPTVSHRAASALAFVDGLSALSECKTATGLPATTSVRYSIYGAEAADRFARRYLARDSFGSNTVNGIVVVARWVERGPQGPVLRAECAQLNTNISAVCEAPGAIQRALIWISTTFGAQLPEVVFRTPPEAREFCFDMQIATCSSELRAILHAEGPLPESARGTELVRVPGCFLRLSPTVLGLRGVAASSNDHGLLLCQEGYEKQAGEFARHFREGLPPPKGSDAEMKLHVVVSHTERVDLNNMVSLYAYGGKPGEPIKKDGNWVFKNTTCIVPLESLMGNFFVLSCDLTSVMPKNAAFGKFMHMHIQYNLDLINKVFPRSHDKRVDDETEIGLLTGDPNQAYAMAAMGIDVSCKRMVIGDALSHLTAMSEKGGLYRMLMSAAERMGLRTSLNDAFSGCAASLQTIIKEESDRNESVCKLKRVADAAIIRHCHKRARPMQASASVEKVRLLLKMLGFCAGKHTTRLDNFLTTPRSLHATISVWRSICECVNADSECELSEAAMHGIQSGLDFVNALVIVLGTAACFMSSDARAFLIVHGRGMNGASVSEALHSGAVESSSFGSIFDANAPVFVLLLKMLSERACLITPLVPCTRQ